jgi:hypothetical protein
MRAAVWRAFDAPADLVGKPAIGHYSQIDPGTLAGNSRNILASTMGNVRTGADSRTSSPSASKAG